MTMSFKTQSIYTIDNPGHQNKSNPIKNTDSEHIIYFDGLETTENELHRIFVKDIKWNPNNLRIHTFNLNMLQKIRRIVYPDLQDE